MGKLTDAEIVKKLVSARVSLLVHQPFFGNLATRLKLIDATNWVPTAGTDGKHFYYNRDFIADLDKDEMLFLFGHEVMHCVYSHMDRRGSRDPRLWNVAGDFVINLELVDYGLGKLIKRKGSIDPCYDEKYRNMYTEEIYNLIKDVPKFNGSNMDSFDVHIDLDGNASGAGLDPDENKGRCNPNGKSDPTGKNGPIPMTEEERRFLRETIKQEVLRAAKANAGKVPGSVARLLEDMTDPKMDWRQMLAQEILSIQKTDYTFKPPSRRSWSTGGAILPGMPPDLKAEVAVALDTSGSMCDQMLRDLMGEVLGIMQQFSDYEIHLWCFDTAVHNPIKITPENAYEIEEYQLAGFGGTMFECNWEHMKHVEMCPSKLLVFTDGMPCNTWGDPDYCETLFLVHGSENIEAPFGITCHYD
jgi:predicted metal-dependent peptidase